MKCIVFNGSPAAENSATSVLAQAFLRGAARAGAETEEVYLIRQDVGHCRGCFSCWFRTPGRCVMQDDMPALLEKYRAADIVVFGTPVYTWNMTACLKNFVDRLAPLKAPRIVPDNGHYDLADAQPRLQQFVALANCGFPGENNFDVLRAAFRCCSPALEIYRNCGKLLTSKAPAARRAAEAYLPAVEQAGFELASSRAVSEATRRALDAPLMPPEDYIRFLGM